MDIYLKLVMLANKGALFLADKPEFEDFTKNEQIIKILAFIEGPVLIAVYVVLGALLALKGAMLGTQIVKSADEPEVRQEKINSLKYLVIGVAVAYGVAFLAQTLVGYVGKSLDAPTLDDSSLLFTTTRLLFNSFF